METTLRCEHLGKPTGVKDGPFGPETEFACRHPRHNLTTDALCVECPDFLVHRDPLPFGLSDSPPKQCPHPTGVVVDRYGRDAGVADLYRGASAFLVLGGPSAKSMPLDLLARRGVLIVSSNNSPAVLPPPIRPHVWLHTDPARKFHDSIWRDPSVLKIVPVREWGLGRSGEKCLRHRNPETGRIEPLVGVSPKEMPGVLGFERNTAFCPDTWMWEPSINRGNDKKSSEAGGWPNVINTMFACLRLSFYLGIKTLYLVGVDFKMNPEQPYGFAQAKSAGGVNANNAAFTKMCVMFDALRPKFEAEGYHVYNSTPNSGLWSFDYVPFEEAIETVTQNFEQSLQTGGWYDSDDKDRTE